MNALIITIALLIATAAIFAVLYFRDRKEVGKYEAKSDRLAHELSDLRCEMARKESLAEECTARLTKERVMEFLRNEKAAEVTEAQNPSFLIFRIRGEEYHFDCSRLPQQVIIRKGWSMEGTDVHWDVLERAAYEVDKALVMVKINVKQNVSYDFMIVSTDHTVAALREDFDFFTSLIADGERILKEEYWKIMAEEHPDECQSDAEDKPTDTPEDLAMKMATANADLKKIQS